MRLTFKKFYLLCVFIILFFNVSYSQNSLHLTKQQWLEDLKVAVKTLIDNHPNLYYRISEAEFQHNAEDAKKNIEQSHSDEECFTALRTFFASIWDGHTRLATDSLPDYQRIFPVRMYDFSDGVFITGIINKYAKYIGAKVLKIGQFPAQEALKKAGTLAFADNEFGRKCQAPVLAVTRNYAFGLGITESIDSLVIQVETTSGKLDTILLTPVAQFGLNVMTSTMDIGPAGIPFNSAFTGTGKELPPYLKHLDGNHNYWYEHDKENRILYMQFNLVVDQQDESFEQFYKRMFKYYDYNTSSIDKFIIDLRFNGGGNGMIVLPFMSEIIKRDKINRIGSFYTLIGRRSFSAAVLFIADLMLHTKTLLVGEPTGAAQNMFSDIRGKGTLPNCRAILLLSTEYFNFAWPANKNYTIPPHYPAPFSSSDFFSGKDPALQAIITNKVRALTTVLQEEGPIAALKYFRETDHNWGAHTNQLSITPITYPIGGNNSCEGTINDIGYNLMSENKMEDAHAAFELNTMLFPASFNVWDSLAEYYMKCGDNKNAVKYYEKSLVLNPDNTNAKDKLQELSKSN